MGGRGNRSRVHGTILADALTRWKVRACSTSGQRCERWQQHGRDEGCELAKNRAGCNVVQDTWNISLDHLRDEAAEAVWVGKIGGAVDETSSDVAKVDSAEGVHGTSVTSDLAVRWVGKTLLAGGDEDIGKSPWVVAGTAVPVVWDALVAVGVHKLAVRSISVRPHRLEEVLGHEAARVLCGVVGQQFVSEHVSSEGECNTGVGWTEVVGVGGNRVLLAVVLVLSKHWRRDHSAGLLIGKVEELL